MDYSKLSKIADSAPLSYQEFSQFKDWFLNRSEFKNNLDWFLDHNFNDSFNLTINDKKFSINSYVKDGKLVFSCRYHHLSGTDIVYVETFSKDPFSDKEANEFLEIVESIVNSEFEYDVKGLLHEVNSQFMHIIDLIKENSTKGKDQDEVLSSIDDFHSELDSKIKSLFKVSDTSSLEDVFNTLMKDCIRFGSKSSAEYATDEISASRDGEGISFSFNGHEFYKAPYSDANYSDFSKELESVKPQD